MIQVRLLSPLAEKSDVTRHAAGIVENFGAEAKAKGLQVLMPNLQQLLWHADERSLPSGKGIVDCSSAVAAHRGGKTQDQYLVLTLFRCITNAAHEVRQPFFIDLDRLHQALDLFLFQILHF